MDNKIFITDDNGKEYEMNILLTFENDNKKYVIVYENGKDDELYAFSYDDNGNLNEITDEKELELVDEVVSAFDNDSEESNA